ncbi:MAG: ATP-grasp domain-containing protein, partial [Acidimicrobiales bacterium]
YFCNVGETPTFVEGDLVVKPCVGAGSLDAKRYGAHEHDRALEHVRALHASGRDALIQPYVDSVDTLGERAMVYIDGSFSHAMTKGAMLNTDQEDRDFLFRREQMSVAMAEPDALRFAEHALKIKGYADLLYARVDLVRMNNEWAIMELELVEPSLFLTFVPEAATRLARSIVRRLEVP